jgi:hypothetical protein
MRKCGINTDTMTDLFGDIIPLVENVRPDLAHPARPGSGPSGKTCKDCRHRVVREMSRRYQKCGLMSLSHGPATDIRLRDAACSCFEAAAW